MFSSSKLNGFSLCEERVAPNPTISSESSGSSTTSSIESEVRSRILLSRKSPGKIDRLSSFSKGRSWRNTLRTPFSVRGPCRKRKEQREPPGMYSYGSEKKKEEERYIEVEIARVLAVPREKRHDVLVGGTRGERLCLGVREGREKAQNSAQRKAWEPFESLLSFRVSGRLRSRAWI